MKKLSHNLRSTDISKVSVFSTKVLASGVTVHFYKNKKAKEVLIKSKKARTYAGYFLISQDLQLCSDWLVELNKTISEFLTLVRSADECPDDSVRQRITQLNSAQFALFIAFVTTYGKCFTEARGRGTRLQINDIDAVWQPTHKKIMQYRHEFAAHAGEKDFQETFTKIVFGPPHGKHGIPFILTVDYRFCNMPTGESKNFGAIISHLEEIVTNRLLKLEKSIIEDISVKGIEYWPQKAR